MFSILDYLKMGAGLATGIILMLAYNALIHDPMIVSIHASAREATKGG